MFGLYCRTRLQLVFPSYLCFRKTPPFITSFSSKSLSGDEKGRSFTVSYFVNSFGFSPELALFLSKKHKIQFESREKPDSVIKLLKHYGLTGTHVSEIARKRPHLFLFNAEKTLLPKLEFFCSIGISGTVLARLLCNNPRILALSLERSLRPCYDLTKTLRIPDEKLRYFFGDFRRNSLERLCIVARNIPVLTAHDVPQSSFPLWVPFYFRALSFDSEKVKTNLHKVISMGFDPSSATFMKALYVISVTDTSKWEQKMEFYSKWGWTEDDVLLAFRRSPLFMSFSEKIISSKMDFYVNTLGCQPSDVAGCPDVLTYSLEKRIIPRCSVIRLLQLEGLIAKEDASIITILQKSEKWFLERFVIKYQEQVPELLTSYKEKISLAKFGLGFDERGGVKQV
ncbi:putative transcription regulator mTERF family [Rosa chinensis]|uniref:Putative transcription regulator mTERF family n=1 Tax=Rosa chinensis TaxID=74649 RepID=A0A2P6RYD4_ROSCH|nr:transcription termination factor MTERF2, chloroplastic [Rosa chinensis]PRQ51424.1 putative transcription regulator mTERF family [Rosa chinensis]